MLDWPRILSRSVLAPGFESTSTAFSILVASSESQLVVSRAPQILPSPLWVTNSPEGPMRQGPHPRPFSLFQVSRPCKQWGCGEAMLENLAVATQGPHEAIWAMGNQHYVSGDQWGKSKLPGFNGRFNGRFTDTLNR